MKYETGQCDRCGCQETAKTKLFTFCEDDLAGPTQNDPASGRTEYKIFKVDLCPDCCAVFAVRMHRKLVDAQKTPLAEFISVHGWRHNPISKF